MDTTKTQSLLEADEHAVLDHLATGKPLNDEVYRRVRERAEEIAERLRQQHGEMNVAVDLIRETRDEE